jgi:hypothetical protein
MASGYIEYIPNSPTRILVFPRLMHVLSTRTRIKKPVINVMIGKSLLRAACY